MGITRFIGRRFTLGLFTMFAVSVLVFLLTHALGDPAAAVLGRDAQQPAVLAAKRAELGLDRPLLEQYWASLRDLLRGDLGTSYGTGRPFADELGARIENSLVLMGCAALLAFPVALLAGVHAAHRRDGRLDRSTTVVALVLASIPEFVIATVLVTALSVDGLELLPAVSSVRGETRPWNDVSGMVLPAVTLALVAVPYVMRSVRASMGDVLDSEYIEAARMNGLSTRSILWRQALPNALGPTLQVAALSLAFMAGGVVVVERIFNYPGIGTTFADAVAAHDVPVVQAITLFVAALYVVGSMLADVATILVTPRLRTRLV